MSALDRLLCLRVLAVVATGWVGVSLVVVFTDETGSTTGMRLARLAALGPAVAALAVLGVAAHARARGEVASLEALGAPPWSALRGAEWGGLVAAAVVMAMLVSPWTDTSSLFPVVRRAVEWEMEEPFTVARAAGVVVTANGALALQGHAQHSLHSAPGALHALACVAPIAITVPAWGVTPMPAFVRAASAVASGAYAVVVLHLLAAGRSSTLIGLECALPLVAAAAWGRVRGS